jgi:hypothetical protein
MRVQDLRMTSVFILCTCDSVPIDVRKSSHVRVRCSTHDGGSHRGSAHLTVDFRMRV